MMCTVFALKMCFGFCNSRSNNSQMLQKIVILKILGNSFSDVHGRGYIFIVIKFQAVVSCNFTYVYSTWGFLYALKKGKEGKKGGELPPLSPIEISCESNMELMYGKKAKERTDFDEISV